MNNNFLLHSGEVQEGAVMMAAVDNGYIYKSTNYGASWPEITGSGSRRWQMIAISETGQYQFAVSRADNKVFKSIDYGATWTGTDNTTYGLSVALGNNGQYALVGSANEIARKSSDSGVNWSNAVSGIYVDCLGAAMSKNGEYQFLTFYNEGIYRSSNSGSSFSNIKASDTYMSIACSETGEYVTAVTDSDVIYVSSDRGASWTQKFITTGKSICVSMSKTGQYQTIVAIRTSPSYLGYIYRSTDYGVSWTQVLVPDVTYWSSVSLSASGKTQVATASLKYQGNAAPGYIYRSKDYGATWTKQLSSGSRNWSSIAMSKI